MSLPALLLTILGIGFMIFIHEAGHFLAARAAGIRVLVFSLGFGPRVFGFRRNGCDYRLSAVPFGGYVLVAGAENFERYALADDELNAKSAGARTLYYAGGVIMNVAFALLVFPLVFHHGVEFTAPVLGRVEPGGLAWQADLRPGDRVVRVDGKEIYAFENLRVEVALAGRKPVRLEIERDGRRWERLVQTKYEAGEGLRQIHVWPAVESTPPSLEVTEGSPAHQAGLRDGDRLLSIDGVAVVPAEAGERVNELEHRGAGAEVTIEVERAGQKQKATFKPEMTGEATRIGVRALPTKVYAVRHDFPAAAVLLAGDVIVSIHGQPFLADSLAGWTSGSEPLRLRVRRGDPAVEVDVPLALTPAERAVLAERVVLTFPSDGDSVPILLAQHAGPAAAAGMRPGDRIAAVAGKKVSTWPELMAAVRAFRGDAMACDVVRDGQPLRLNLLPTRTLDPGFRAAGNYQREIYKVDGVGNAIHAGLVCSADMLKQLYVTLKEMVTGDVSAKNLGGIIQISRVSYAFAESGFARFLYFLAMLSLNLAFVNVLPIPVLDGGHLLFVLIEKIKGSPVSARVHGYSLTLGLVFVVGLMVFVTYNDIVRLFLIAYLRLVRVGLLLSPAADVVAGMALSGLPWSLAVVRAALASVCVYAAGMVLNDHADRALDAKQRPERPIPRGQVSAGTALLLGLLLIGAGCAASPLPLYHAGLAALVLGYDYALKRVLFLGALTMGTLRALNLVAGGVVVGGVAPSALLVHAAIAYFIYIVAVTLLGALEDEPKVKAKAVVSLALAAPLSACVALLKTPHATVAASLGFALLVLFWFVALRRPAWDQKAIRRAMTFLLLGTMLYTSLLCAGMGRIAEAMGIFAAALVGRRISRYIAVT